MTFDSRLADDLKEQLAGLGHITERRMFGGAGIYCDGQIFALMIDGDLYLKTNETDRDAFAAEGCGPFTFETKNGQKTITSYYRTPERLIDDPDELEVWSRRAIAAGKQASATKPRKIANDGKLRRG